MPKLDKHVAHHNAWIAEATWSLVNERVSTSRESGRDQVQIRRLGRAIMEALKKDRRWWEEMAGENVYQLLNGYPQLPHEVWRRMKGWYRVAVDHAPPPTRVTLKQITVERVELYRYVNNPRREYPNIFDAHPHQRLHNYRGGGLMVGADNMGTQVRRNLPDARRESTGVAVGTLGRRCGKRGSTYNIRPRGAGEKGRRRRGGWGGIEGEN